VTATTVDQPLASRAPDPTTGGAPGAAGQAEGQVETGGVRWDLGPRYMLRVAGLPFDAVDTQRAPRSLEWADAVLDGERELSAAGAGLSELLHAAIATLDEQGRRVVLAVRRGVFKNKPPADPDEALRLLAAQPAAHAALADWLAARARWERLREQGPGLLDEETEAARGRLRALAVAPHLRQGLLLASPSLDTALENLLRKDGSAVSKRDRRTERALLDFLTRVAAKTSPFSTFTGVAIGEFTSGGTGLFDQRVPAAWRSHPRINVSALARLAELITESDELRDDLPVMLTAGWQAQADRVRYVRHTTVHGDTDSTVTFDLVLDEVFFLRASAALRSILDLLEHEPAPRYGEFVGRLAQASGAPRADCDRYARKLMALGLLRVPVLRIDSHHDDPLRDLISRLPSLDRPWAYALAQRLAHIADQVDGYPGADLPRRRDALAQVRAELEAAHTDLGRPDEPVLRTLVYEDARAGDVLPGCDRAAFLEHVARPLHALGGVLPVFDPMLAHRLTLRGYFLARYGRGGRCDDMVSFIHEFHEDLYTQYLSVARGRRAFDEEGCYVPQENWLRLPEIEALDQARSGLAGHMRELWRDGAAGPEVQLGEDALACAAERVAPLAGILRPEGHFIQLAWPSGSGPAGEPGPDGQAAAPLVILNRSFSGLSFPFSRFTHCFADLPGDDDGQPGLAALLRRHHRGLGADDAVFAEIVGAAVTTNLNLHGRLTDYQILCPDEHSSLPPQAHIPLADLYVMHDPATDRVLLRSRSLDREVVPVYLGYLLPMALPYIPRTLLLFSPSALSFVDMWAGVPQAAPDGGITSRPRVRYRNVVVHRRQWTLDAGALPAHRPGAPQDERLLDWRRWQRRHGLPDRLFARFDADGRRAKPHYTDLASPAFQALLDGRAKAGGQIRLEEMLPDPEQLYVTSPDGKHVAELAVEINAHYPPPARAEGAS
jgi:hypothetical protein